jgi:hypothetical protein
VDNMHLTEEQLILFMDRELQHDAAVNAERHLLECLACSAQLKTIHKASAAYTMGPGGRLLCPLR